MFPHVLVEWASCGPCLIFPPQEVEQHLLNDWFGQQIEMTMEMTFDLAAQKNGPLNSRIKKVHTVLTKSGASPLADHYPPILFVLAEKCH